jgi:nicotinate-nucleotide adenylyltransferase
MTETGDGEPMRIGLFGGTFNPVHLGHLRAALEVSEGFPLDECRLIPAAVPPHKHTGTLAAAEARLEMLRQAVTGQPSLRVSEIELRRPGPSYTIDTIRRIAKEAPNGAELYLILGLDAFLDLHSWKSYRQLLRATAFIVLTRPDAAIGGPKAACRALERYLQQTISAEYRPSAAAVFAHPEFKPVHCFEITLLDISSSQIRNVIRSGRSARYLVPESVLDYIAKGGLYA